MNKKQSMTDGEWNMGKTIRIEHKSAGPGMKYLGWSGRGWADGGPLSAGPLNSQAPSWDEAGKEIGINMVRMGFTMKHFVAAENNSNHSLLESIKKGMENKQVSWAKSQHTSYSDCLDRCTDLGWKMLVCINPSLNQDWEPHLITPSSEFLNLWESFCFHLARYLDQHWPQTADFFEITNEPDIGYFDGETSLPGYKGIRFGISPSQYLMLLERAHQGIKRAAPHAQIIGPSLSRWNKKWVQKILQKGPSFLDGLSYHNVRGDLKDARVITKARSLLSDVRSPSAHRIFNSEWAWWPHHDTHDVQTALRVARILSLQAKAGAFASLYLGPAQPRDFKKGLGVLKFDPHNPDSIEKTTTFYAFQIMAQGVLGGRRLEVKNPFKTFSSLALYKDGQFIVTLFNPGKKHVKEVSLSWDKTLQVTPGSPMKLRTFHPKRFDYFKKTDYNAGFELNILPYSITQVRVRGVFQNEQDRKNRPKNS
ncbi:MAG: hypothetical protein GF421_03195 [Candidatus Aminicenantes bacterium]|nr:hypothetical protein [Candidatus Aminicenantes bacterium]